MNHTVRSLTFSALALFATLAFAADPPAAAPGSVTSIEQDLLDVSTIGRVMNLAAHPDDEDGATLALCRHGRGLFTVAVFANCGEGGQNEIGPELYDDLGAIREKETLAATALEGAEAAILGLKDFGYSKNAPETFSKWGEDRVTERVVWAIRKYRPDVIFTNHDPVTGHGQHRAVAIAARAAFDLAGDPTKYTEQLRGDVKPWSPSIYMERLDAPGSEDDDAKKKIAAIPASEIVKLDVDVVDPIRGTTYREQALEALQKHQSQGRWSSLGAKERTWHVIRRRDEQFLKPGDSPFDAGNLTRLRMFRAIAANALDKNEQITLLTPDLLHHAWPAPLDRSALVTALFAARDHVQVALDPATAPTPQRTELLHDWIDLHDRFDHALADALGIRPDMFAQVGATPVHTLPADVELASTAGGAHALTYKPNGKTFEVESRATPPAPARTLPAFSFRPADVLAIGKPGVAAVSVRTLLEVELPPQDAKPKDAPKDWAPLPRPALPITISGPGGATVFSGEVPANAAGHATIPVKFSTSLPADGAATFGLATSDATFSARRIDVAIRDGLHVGVVTSYDGTTATALEDLGVDVRDLSADDLAFRDLSELDAVFVDLRAYLVRDDLTKFNARLLDYARAGGVLVVFYQKTFDWNAKENGGHVFAPFPLELTSDRVTDETAPMTLLIPKHPLFTTPNAIVASDFDGWIHERGLYFPKKDHAPEYQELLATSDPGEPALSTGLLVAPLGTGTYVYTCLAWYRQWRNHNAGAYRFLANLASLRRSRPT